MRGEGGRLRPLPLEWAHLSFSSQQFGDTMLWLVSPGLDLSVPGYHVLEVLSIVITPSLVRAEGPCSFSPLPYKPSRQKQFEIFAPGG